ncbi:TPM domain-containing protein [Massilia sp. Dwa41.01b]|uniref:TPM domain-containing protein n=1 Tax=unclassified Massilia TaxID=2609279 RepID=UPI0016006959|nr:MULTISPECIES: TPM domain-containing protein [unclassified Massilia]QNA90584.1 TPM domain-containing protein [Massilia sp. Dwa41.01b]QNA97815.1 TPM domain-containing protein [Massilia sp. Se16.2.3]
MGMLLPACAYAAGISCLLTFAIWMGAKRFLLGAFLAGVSLLCTASEQYAAPPARVTDTAKVLGPSAASLDHTLREFERATGHQVFVLTVQTSGTLPIDQYAVEVFQKWKLGQAGVDDGVLFVVAVADRAVRIEVGYGLEGTLTDAQCSRIIHDIVAPAFEKGRYDTGVVSGVEAILRTLSPMPPPTAVVQELPAEPSRPSPATSPRALLAFAGVVLTGLAMLTVGLGIGGLCLFSVVALLFSAAPVLGVYGKLVFTAAIAAWLCARWFHIAENVRKYHLPSSKNPFLTWLWIYFCTRGSGDPADTGQHSAMTFTVTFDSADARDDRSSDGADCPGNGGRSGGGGASGQW